MAKLQKKGYIAAIFILSFVQVIVVESVHRSSFIQVLRWMWLYKNEWFANYAVALCLLALVAALVKRIDWSFFLVMLLSLLITLVSRMKVAYLGEPLMPWDIVLFNEACHIAAQFPGTEYLGLVLGIVLSVSALLFFVRRIPPHLRRLEGGFLLSAAAACLCGIFLFSVGADRIVHSREKLGIAMICWDQGENYNTNGVLVSFLMNSQWLIVEKPAEYYPDRVLSVLGDAAGYGEEGRKEPGPNSTAKPNIIMVMNEAFWDPTVLDKVSFSQDPLPFFRSLQKDHISGQLLVPVFGGGTVNTEFEVLTGNAMGFLPSGSISYAQYMRRPVDSLASILTRQGYGATAVHSYYHWFYRRTEVYKNLGFCKYISAEYFPEPEYKGDYIADSEVSRLIIEETRKSPEPDFIFAVTMQNHGPYRKQAEDDDTLTVSGPLSEEAQSMLEAYARGVRDADFSLQALVEHFAKCDEATIIVFFGDHLPLLGEGYQVYRETGFYKGDGSAEEFRRMHSVPLVIWSNYFSGEEGIYLNSSFLGPYILRLASLEGNLYLDYVYVLSQRMPLVLPEQFRSREDSVLEDYRLLQYDILLGDRFLYGKEEPRVVKEEFFLGREKNETSGEKRQAKK